MSKQLSIGESNLELVESFNEAVFVDHAFDRLDEFVAPGIVQTQGEELLFEGIDGMRAYFEGMLDAYEGLEMEVREMVADEDTVIYSFRMDATATEDIEMGGELVDAAGTDLRWDGFVSLTIEDGKIIESHLLTDEASVLRQLGVLPQRAA